MTEQLTSDPRRPPSPAPGSLSDRVKSLQLPHENETRHAASERLAWLLCLVLGGLTSWLAWQRSNSKPPPPIESENAESGKLETVSGQAAHDTPPTRREGLVHQDSGYIVPAHQILVSPKVTGMLMKLNVEEGLRVKRGDVLAVLETTDYDADLRRAKATRELARKRLEELERGSRPEEITQSEQELLEAQANLEDVERTYLRYKDLFVKKGVTEQELLNSESTFTAMKRRVGKLTAAVALMREGPRIERIEQARAEVQQVEADVSKAEWRLNNCTITAPISGTILKKNAEEGNIVNPIAFQGSFSLCDMADLSDLEVDLTVQESNIAKVFKNQRCKIQAEAFPERRYDGFVSRLMPIADRSKGAVPVRVKVRVPADEEGVFLKPEMRVTVWFYSDTVSAGSGN